MRTARTMKLIQSTFVIALVSLLVCDQSKGDCNRAAAAAAADAAAADDDADDGSRREEGKLKSVSFNGQENHDQKYWPHYYGHHHHLHGGAESMRSSGGNFWLVLCTFTTAATLGMNK